MAGSWPEAGSGGHWSTGSHGALLRRGRRPRWRIRASGGPRAADAQAADLPALWSAGV